MDEVLFPAFGPLRDREGLVHVEFVEDYDCEWLGHPKYRRLFIAAGMRLWVHESWADEWLEEHAVRLVP